MEGLLGSSSCPAHPCCSSEVCLPRGKSLCRSYPHLRLVSILRHHISLAGLACLPRPCLPQQPDFPLLPMQMLMVGRTRPLPLLNQCSSRLGLLTSASFAFPVQNVSENPSALLFSLRRCPIKRGLLVRILVSSWAVFLFGVNPHLRIFFC